VKFVSKRDTWLSITIWSSVLVMILAGFSPLFKSGTGVVGGTIIFLVCFLSALLTAWLWMATYYVLNESELFVRCGPIKKSIPYNSITKIQPIRSLLASMATSSQRVEIRYGKYGIIHISPLEQETFLTEIKKRML